MGKPRSRTLLILSAITVALSACGPVRPIDWRPYSLRLAQGMTERQAISAIGYQPDRAQVTTCAAGTNDAWRCRILSFDSVNLHELTLYESDISGEWRLSSWSVL